MFKVICLATALLSANALFLSCGEKKEIEAFPDRFVGIGVELRMEAAGAHVVRVISESAAEESGLKSGDVILQAAGSSLRGKALVEVVNLLRGERDSTVSILVRTQSGESELNVVRKPVKL